MRHWKATLIITTICGWTQPALAAPSTTSEGGTLATVSEQFVAGDGYKTQDVDALNQTIEQQLTPINPNSVFLPSGSLSPFVKAILALEANEAELERVRYRLRYGQQMIATPPKASLLPVSFVQIDRFNIGPGIRKELVLDLGPELVAPPAVFGEGPHVSWRLAMHPIQGQQANVMAASRTEISDTGASAESCLGTPCLDTGLAIMNAAPWDETPVPDREQDVTYQTQRNGLLTPAAAIDMLTKDFSYEAREGVEISEPFAEAIIEMNLAQDASLHSALREGKLMDDSVSAIWQSIAAMPSGPGFAAQFYAARAFECYRGPKFANPGEYCP